MVAAISSEEEIQEILADSTMPVAEEWAIHDYEDFDSLGLPRV